MIWFFGILAVLAGLVLAVSAVAAKLLFILLVVAAGGSILGFEAAQPFVDPLLKWWLIALGTAIVSYLVTVLSAAITADNL